MPITPDSRDSKLVEVKATASPMNENPFEHLCSNGTRFKCDRCDFKATIKVFDWPIHDALFAQDVAEMAGWHALNIWPKLNGFAGYDTIHFEFEHE